MTRRRDIIVYAYDTLNRRTSETPPNGTPATSYAYDLAGRVTSVSTNGPTIRGPVPPSGASVQYATNMTYDQLNRPISVSWSPVLSQAPASASTVSFGYGYDRNNRQLTQTTTDNSWWSVPSTSSNVSYTVNSLNQYTAVGTNAPTYDGGGNLANAATFDPAPTASAGSTDYVTDPDNRLLLEYDGVSGAIKHWYAYGLGPNDVLSETDVQAGTRKTVVPDKQGSVLATLDSGTGTLTKQGFAPYGESGNATGPFAYTGQYLDVSGLYNYRARIYSAALGRFLQPDPVGYGGGRNLYAYVDNDPLNRTDPSGNIALVDNIVGGVIATGVDFGAQYLNSYRADRPFTYNRVQGGVAFGIGFATSGLSSFAEGAIEGASALAIGGRVAANTAIGTAGSVGQAAILNNVDNQNNGYLSAAFYGGAFSALGATVGQNAAIRNALYEVAFERASIGEQNIYTGVVNTTAITGVQLNTPLIISPSAQVGNFLSNLSGFAPSEATRSGSNSSPSSK